MQRADLEFLFADDRWATRRILGQALLTAAGRSPGDLDMIFFVEELAAVAPTPPG